jgi:anaerobic magnesium-protoporphyrin IX monomethyl ester cyclase
MMDTIDCLLVNVPYYHPERPMEMWHQRIEYFVLKMERIIRNRYLYGNAEWPQQKSIQICYEGLLSIGQFVMDQGYHVEFFFPEVTESDISSYLERYFEALRGYLRQHDVKCVGIGPVTASYPLAQVITREIKKFSPHTQTVLGGHHATFLPENVLRESPSVDVAVRHEGETQMLALCQGKPLSEIPGISYRENSRIRHNTNAPLLEGKDIPSIALSLLPKWVFQRDILLNIGTGRGCPYRCFFCTDKVFWRGKARFKEVEHVLKELKTVIEDFKIKKVRFTDDTFTLKKDFVIEIGKRLKSERIGFEGIQAWTRIDAISDRIVDALKSIGEKVEICVGVESGSPSVLFKMNKRITPHQVVDGLKKIKKHEILTHSFWIVGHPGSNPEREAESLSFLDKLMSKGLCSICETSVFQPYPGSEASENPGEHKVVIDSFHWSNYRENPPFFPPVSHLEDFSSFEITQWYWTFRLHVLKWLSEALGYTFEDLNEL